MTDNAYLDTVSRLEPEIAMVDHGVAFDARKRMRELIAKLETATEGSRELDFAIAIAVGKWRRATAPENPGNFVDQHGHIRSGGDWRTLPHYTTSIDAAMTLSPDGAEYSISTLYGIAAVEIPLNFGDAAPEIVQRKDGNVVLAFVTCALRARLANPEDTRKEQG